MELNKYEIFMQALANGSLTKTAQKLDYTQSAISHSIASLEAELGVSLLVRNRTGITLTPEGEELLPYIHSITKSISNLMDCVNCLHGLQSGIVRINTMPSIAMHILPTAIAYFRGHYPGIRFEINTDDFYANYRSIMDGVSDFGFICTNEMMAYPHLNQCEVLPFTREKMMVVLPVHHSLTSCKTISLETLQNENFILVQGGSEETNPIFQQHGIVPNILFYLRDAFTIMSMVEMGIGISIIPEMSILRHPYQLEVRELSMPAYRNISIIYRKQPLLSNAAKEFLDVLMGLFVDFLP